MGAKKPLLSENLTAMCNIPARVFVPSRPEFFRGVLFLAFLQLRLPDNAVEAYHGKPVLQAAPNARSSTRKWRIASLPWTILPGRPGAYDEFDEKLIGQDGRTYFPADHPGE